MNLSPLVADSSPFHGIALMALVQKSEGRVIIVVQVEKRRFAIFVLVTHLARPDVHPSGVEGVYVLRIPSATVVIHSHAPGKVHGDRGTVIGAPPNGGIHLVKKLAERL
jgi:hypothetical protein